MDLITFDITPNKKAIIMKSNYLAVIGEVEWSRVVVPMASFQPVLQNHNESEGILFRLSDGRPFTLYGGIVSRVGTKTYTNPPNLDELVDDLINLAEW